MTCPSIYFEKLILEGFRSYRERTEFIFTEGINVYVGENEKGKTTMLLGIVAVIFGLISSQNPDEPFSRENTRNRHNPGSFYGHLYFTCESVKYRIERDFETNRVAVFRRDNSGDFNLIIEGEHNPNARKRFRAYEEMVEEIFSMGSRSLFFETFFIMQPLPEADGVGKELQAILAGGGDSFAGGPEYLLDEIKGITKYTGPNDWNVTTKNMQKDGILEELKNRIDHINKTIEENKDATEGLAKAFEEEISIRSQLEKAREKEKKLEVFYKALLRWKELGEEYGKARDKSIEYEDKLIKEEHLRGELEKHNQRIEGEHPKYINRDRSTLDHLILHRAWSGKLKEVKEQVEGYKDRTDDLDEDIKNLSQQEISHLERFLGNEPVENLKRSREDCRRFGEVFENNRDLTEKIERIDREIGEKYSLIHEADGVDRDIFSRWPHDRDLLKGELGRAENKVCDLMEEQRDYDGRRGAIGDKYPFGASFDFNEEANLKKKHSLHEKEEKLTGEIDRAREKIKPIFFYIPGLLIFILFVYRGYVTNSPNYGLLGILIGLTFTSLPYMYNRRTLKPLEEKKRKIEEEILNIRDFGPGNIGDMLKELENYKLEMEFFEGNFQRTTDEDIEKAKELLDDVLSKKEEFDRRFSTYERIHGDLKTTYDSYASLLKERENLYNRARIHWPDPFEFPELAADDWEDARGALEFCRAYYRDEMKPEIHTLKDLFEAIGGEDGEKHNTLAKNIEEKIKKLAEKRGEADKARALLNSAGDEAEKLEKQIGENSRTIEDLIGDDPDMMIEDFKKYLSLADQGMELKARYDAFVSENDIKDRDDLRKKQDEFNRLAHLRLKIWNDFIENNPGLPTIEDGTDRESIDLKISDIKEKEGVAGRQVKELEDENFRVKQKLAELQGKDTINLAHREIERDELLREEKQWEFTLRVCVTAYKELKNTIVIYRESHRELLEEKATLYLWEMTGQGHRKILFDDEFSLIVTEHGRPVSISGLSRGTRDQVYISLRLGLADLLSDNRSLPVIFDDSFVGTDQRRLEKIRELIEKTALERQVILLSHNEIYEDWGEEIQVRGVL